MRMICRISVFRIKEMLAQNANILFCVNKVLRSQNFLRFSLSNLQISKFRQDKIYLFFQKQSMFIAQTNPPPLPKEQDLLKQAIQVRKLTMQDYSEHINMEVVSQILSQKIFFLEGRAKGSRKESTGVKFQCHVLYYYNLFKQVHQDVHIFTIASKKLFLVLLQLGCILIVGSQWVGLDRVSLVRKIPQVESKKICYRFVVVGQGRAEN
eukprot:TRINITY_DN1736_c0_g1_i11.p1 TRINITY_DN1736_c0_g1~~TRINITY_DN1736_c0_g1_i11.p1  ORF type:complete len:209 (+),score=7.05 TRINITY_DN1736_c0_g1_i11:431-1057(+)